MARPTLAQARAQYVHRYTMEHVPAWSRRAAPNGLFCAPQFSSDAEWYANTVFAGEGDLADKRHCYTSGQTWPLGLWLDQPYRSSPIVGCGTRPAL